MNGSTLEQKLSQIDSAIAKLESGSLPLEESLALYNEAITTTKACILELEDAKLTVEKINTDVNKETP